jgi:hypothetical protein
MLLVTSAGLVNRYNNNLNFCVDKSFIFFSGVSTLDDYLGELFTVQQPRSFFPRH